MKHFNLLVLFALSSTFCFSQYAPLSWAKALQGKSAPYNSYCDVVEMEADAAGNVYVCGNYVDTLVPDYNNQSYMELGSDGYGFFAKYDAAGNFLWSKRITRVMMTDLCLDRHGNIYLTGHFDNINSVDFDPGNNTAIITVPQIAMFFAKYDNNGNYIMVKTIEMSYIGETETSVIATDSNSNIFIGGRFRSSIDLDPGAGLAYINNPNTTWNCNNCPIGFYAKYDSAGAYQWGYRDLASYEVKEIAVNQSTGDIIVGATRGTGFRYVRANGVSTDSTITGIYGHTCTSALFDAAGNLYFGGYFSDNSGDLDWGPGTVSASTTGITDVKNFVVKYDANRVFQWMGVYDLDGVLSSFTYEFELNLSSDGNLLAAFDAVATGSTIRGFTKISTATNGPQLWTPVIFGNGQSGYGHAANIVSVGNSGSFYFQITQGYANQTTVFDVDPNGTTNNITALGFYGLIAKYGDCTAVPATPGTITGTAALCSAGAQTYSVPEVPGVSSYTWTLPGGWSGTSNTHSIVATPSANGGTISVVANNVCGASTPRTLAVTYTAPPNVTASTTLATVCAGTPVTLSGGGATTYTWNNGVNNGVAFVPASTLTYTVTGTTSGCSATATVSVTVNSIPAVGASATASTVCAGAPTTLNGSGATTYTWNNGVSNGVAFVPASTLTYTVTGTTSGCSATATVSVTVNSIPAVGASATASTVCAGEQTTLNGSGANTYTWSDGVTDNTAFTPASTLTYTVTGTTSGCTATATVSVTVNALPDVEATATDTALCPGESTTLSGAGADSYVWSGGVTDNVAFTPTSTFTYTVTGTTSGCTATADVLITVNTVDSVSISYSGDTICVGETATLVALGAVNYLWSTTDITGSVSVSPMATTMYSVTANDANNCTSADSKEVAVHEAVDVSTTVNGFTITAVAANAGYQWRNCTTNTDIAFANSQSYTATANGDYEVVVTAASGCAGTSACVNITGVGISMPIEDVISVSPNPFSSEIQLTLPAFQAGDVLEIHSATGQLVRRESITAARHRVYLPDLSTGVYLFTVKTGTGVYQKTLAKQ